MNNQNPEVVFKKYDILIEDLRRGVDAINVRLNQISKEHEELRQKPDVPSDFKEFKYFLDQKIKSIFDALELYSSQFSEVKLQFSREVEQNRKDRLEKNDDKKKLNGIIDLLESHKQEFNQRISGLGDSISQVSSFAKEYTLKSIEKLKQEIAVTPSSILETNKNILLKLEECKMDCSNAMLKLSNFETQFTLFQRKLENLDIRIKKFELEKQG